MLKAPHLAAYIVSLLAIALLPTRLFGEETSTMESGRSLNLKNESAAALSIAAGNASSQSYSLTHISKLKHLEINEHTLQGSYLLGRADGSRNAENWLGAYRYDRYFYPWMSWYAANRWEGDEFAGYQYRTFIMTGPKFIIAKATNFTLTAEAGYTFLHENKVGPDTDNRHLGRLFAEAVYTVSESSNFTNSAELLKDLTRSKDLLFTFSSALLAKVSTIFSLKGELTAKLNNEPDAGLKKLDVALTMSLVASY